MACGLMCIPVVAHAYNPLEQFDISINQSRTPHRGFDCLADQELRKVARPPQERPLHAAMYMTLAKAWLQWLNKLGLCRNEMESTSQILVVVSKDHRRTVRIFPRV